ncbi:MAG: hypothetical protein JWN44_1075 [Myxococcales bacterium]|nr:hypothetical protein [Myxococcales bacterium]
MARTLVRRSALSTALISLFALGGRAGADGITLQPGQKLLAPITFKQLTVFPVVQTAANRDAGQYLTLSDGLQKKLVAVSELAGGGSVNTLLVHNKSDKPLLVLGGEVVLGGQQDRILGQDTIVPAHEQLRVQVFCVEHGRWSGGRHFESAQGMADTKIRYRAKYRADQSQVWAEVAKKNAAHGAAPSTGTYRNLAAGDEGKKALDPYRAAVGGAMAKLADKSNVVGIIAAVNGRVTSVELFARPELFAAYREKLLDSIYMGAADAPVVDKAEPPKPEAITAFMQKAKVAPAKKSLETKAGTTSESRGDGVVSSTVRSPAAAAAPVYESYQAAE